MRFALAHMSCAGAWAWGEVPERLRDAGHEVCAPDLSLVAGVTPDDHARDLVEVAGSADVVVGHSYGGMVAPAACTPLGASAVVVIDGFVPDPGESAFELAPMRCEGRRAEAASRGDGMWTAGLDSSAPGTPEWFDWLEPMPISAFEAPVSFDGLPSRRLFVRCLKEPDFAGQADRARERGWRVEEVDTFHALPLLDPAITVKLLLEASGGAGTFGPA